MNWGVFGGERGVGCWDGVVRYFVVGVDGGGVIRRIVDRWCVDGGSVDRRRVDRCCSSGFAVCGFTTCYLVESCRAVHLCRVLAHDGRVAESVVFLHKLQRI